MFKSKLGECNDHNVTKNGSRLECVKNDQLKDIVSFVVIIVSAGRHNLGDLDNAKVQFTEIAKLASSYKIMLIRIAVLYIYTYLDIIFIMN